MTREEIEAMYAVGEKVNLPHLFNFVDCNLSFDEGLTSGEYFMIRQHWTDSTRLLTINMIAMMIRELLEYRSFCVARPPKDWRRVKRIDYRVGPMSIVAGVDDERKDFRNWKETFLLPIVCKYVLDEDITKIHNWEQA